MGTLLKAIIMSHENGGSYCIDSTGSFHFVKGFQNVAIGTEITIKKKKPIYLRKLFIACAAIAIIAAIVGFTCIKFSGGNDSYNIGNTPTSQVFLSEAMF